MNDNVLQKYAARNGESVAGLSAACDSDAADDLGSFGVLRGIRDRAVMLELRKKTGTILAIGYGWIDKIEFDPSSGITLHAGGQRISIKGRNLNTEIQPRVRLFEGITRHRVSFIQEADEPARLKADKSATVIESIAW